MSSHAVKFLGEAAFLDKVQLQLLDLTLQKIDGLIDQTQERVGSHFGRGVSNAVGVEKLSPDDGGVCSDSAKNIFYSLCKALCIKALETIKVNRFA